MYELFERYQAETQRLLGARDELANRRLAQISEELRTAMTDLLAQPVAACDENNYVEVEATLDGRLTSVRITAYAMRDLSVTALGTACVDAIKAVREKASREFKQRVGEPPAELLADPLAPVRRATRQ